MNRRWLASAAVIVVLGAAPASWADQWYEHYARAEAALAAENPETAIDELGKALERRGDSGVHVRTYGMRVTDYFPYLKLGIAYFKAGQLEAALRAFDTEERLGAVGRSESAMAELVRYRGLAAGELERVRSERRRALNELVERNLTEARRLRAAGRIDDAMGAVDRALALAPEDGAASALAAELRGEIARRRDEVERRERAAELIAEGQRLRAAGELAESAARFRQAETLAPAGAASGLLAAVQAELVARTTAGAAPVPDEQLRQAEDLLAAGRIDDALGTVQEVLARVPESTEAANLESRILERIADRDRDAETKRLLAEAEAGLAAGDPEAAIAAANLVLGGERDHGEALEVIRRAYGVLSRRLLGAAEAENLPPAIRFADLRTETRDGEPVQRVSEPDFRLSGVVIDDSEVSIRATDSAGVELSTAVSVQTVGGIRITEFRVDAKLLPGVSAVELAATDDAGSSSRSRYLVEYRRPAIRSPWLWGLLTGAALALAGGSFVRRWATSRRLRRQRFNPFVAGPPVLDPSLLVGRDALLDRVLATVPNNSLLLLGERRIGKTTVLHQLRRRLPELDHPQFCFLPVPVDLQGVAEDEFFATVAEAVGEAIGDGPMAAARSTPGYDSRALVRDLRRVLPELECPDGRRPKIVLLLDEIDELNQYSHRTNQRLRGLFMRSFADQLVAVAAGVGIAREWEHEGSPWYNFFEELEVGPVDATAAKRLLVEPLKGVIVVDEAAVRWIIEIADGRPYLLQKIALAAVQRVHAHDRTRMTVADVEAVVRT